MPAQQMVLPAVVEADAANDCSPSIHADHSPRVALVAQGGGGCIHLNDESLPDEAARDFREQVEAAQGRRGRPRKYASDADRKAAYRAGKARIDYTDKPEIKATISRLASQFEVGENEVLQELVRFALCNRDWSRMGFAARRVDGALQ
ncbi:hypothetical protein [Paracidovorax citrulli]|uniref:hypothetical protein n=1 Tax=Paracidovorax citrulli TaxID=80869 RepID=UPI000A3DD558|nr:hypothetical protein [Paracidovorax citrulli]UEG48117.1 hypothetical protein LKW27_09795 [Paracidovorax citrulli]UMT96625.1 hypothetical protein FRC97_17385 [Paracidovorax citrulli]